MTLYYVLLIIMTMLGAVASLFLKRASSFQNLMSLVKNTNLYLGAFLQKWTLKGLRLQPELYFSKYFS